MPTLPRFKIWRLPSYPRFCPHRYSSMCFNYKWPCAFLLLLSFMVTCLMSFLPYIYGRGISFSVLLSPKPPPSVFFWPIWFSWSHLLSLPPSHFCNLRRNERSPSQVIILCRWRGPMVCSRIAKWVKDREYESQQDLQKASILTVLQGLSLCVWTPGMPRTKKRWLTPTPHLVGGDTETHGRKGPCPKPGLSGTHHSQFSVQGILLRLSQRQPVSLVWKTGREKRREGWKAEYAALMHILVKKDLYEKQISWKGREESVPYIAGPFQPCFDSCWKGYPVFLSSTCRPVLGKPLHLYFSLQGCVPANDLQPWCLALQTAFWKMGQRLMEAHIRTGEQNGWDGGSLIVNQMKEW